MPKHRYNKAANSFSSRIAIFLNVLQRSNDGCSSSPFNLLNVTFDVGGSRESPERQI